MNTIVYACDANYAGLTAISAVSALAHNPGCRIVLLGYKLAEESREIVRTRVEKAKGVFAYFDVSPQIKNLVEKGYDGYTSYAAYARVFIPEILNGEGRVLYLDCDTLVAGSLNELFETDLHGKPFALAGDCIVSAYKKYISLSADRPYFNSGVMLMDLAKWRERRCTERILEELVHPHGPNPLGDQDVIVRCFPDETAALSPRWNFLSQYFMLSYDGLRRIVGAECPLPYTRTDYVQARKAAAVYHFSGNTFGRPWFTSSKHPLREAYRKAAAEAGLAEIAEQKRPLAIEYRIQRFLFAVLPQGVFDVVCRLMLRTHVRLTYRV